MTLFDDPIREEDQIIRARGRVVWSRQCALCDHACIEREWICDCCQQISRAGAESYCLGALEANILRPLLPPHWPEHARGYIAADHELRVELEVFDRK